MTKAIKCVSIAAAFFSSAPAFGQGAKAPAAPEDREPVTLEIEGLVLEYVPRELGRGRKTARVEMEALCGAEATLEVEKPIGYRRDSLPAGEYSIRVEREESGASFLVLEPAPSEEGDGNGGNSAEEAEAKPNTVKEGDAADAREKKRSSRTSESAGKDAPGPAREGGKGKAAKSQAAEEKAGKAGKAEKSETAEKTEKAEPKLRLPLKLGPCEKTSDLVSFALVSRGKSGRFLITLRAGSTEARSPTIRFIEE
jgi:hypothetical protein